MNKRLIEDDDFNDTIEDVGSQAEDLRLNVQSIINLANQLKQNPTPDTLNDFKDVKKTVESQIESFAKSMKLLQDSTSGNEGRVKQTAKLETAIQKEVKTYEAKKDEFNLLLKNTSFSEAKLEKEEKKKIGSNEQSTVVTKRENDMPQVQIYNQTEFIEKRQKDLEKMHSEAGEINQMAKDINKKVYESDEKLDKMNHKLEKEVVGNLKAANQDLAAAEDITKARGRNYCVLIGLLAAGVGVIGFTVYFLFK